MEAELDLQERSRTILMGTRVVCELHRFVFGKIYPNLAGRMRGPDLQEFVSFGGNHSGVHWRDVPGDRADREAQVQRMIRELDSEIPPGRYELSEVVKVGAWYHAHVVRIHPFLNGNGRVSRLCLNYFAYRYGLTTFPVIGEKEDAYIGALDSFMRPGHEVDPLVRYLAPRMIT